MSSIILCGLLINILYLAFIALGGRMDAPYDVITTPMLCLVLIRRGVVLGTEHSCFLSVLQMILLKVYNFVFGFIICSEIHSLLGLRRVVFGVAWEIA